MKIAVVTLDALGDQVLRSGWMRALRGMYPEAGITVLCSDRTAGFWQSCPYVNSVHSGGLLDGIFPMEPNSDLVINPRPAPDWFGGAIVTKASVGPGGQTVGFWFKDPNPTFYKLNGHAPLGEPAWRSPFRLLRNLGYEGEDLKPEWWLPLLRNELPHTISLGISAGANHKVWPARQWANLIAAWPEKCFMLVGSKDDGPLGQAIINCLPSDDLTRVSNVAGRTDIAELGQLMARVELHIGNDSAPVHIAAAVGTPCIVVHWLRCFDEMFAYDRGFDPVGVPYRIVGPSREFTRDETLRGEAVASVSVDRVVAAAKELLG